MARLPARDASACPSSACARATTPTSTSTSPATCSSSRATARACCMQVFQKQEAILGGVDEAIAVLKLCAGRHVDGGWEDGWSELEVRALDEGDEIAPHETVMTIEGDYGLFAHLETVYLGCMARRTLVMRNVKAVVEAAHGKPILFFPARHDHWLVQTGDGWAAHVAGAIGVSTDAQASWWGGRGVGTVPHALMAAFGGDTVAAARAVRRPLPRRDEHHGPRRLRERLGRAPRSRSPPRWATACGACGWTPSEQLVDVALQDEPDPDSHRGVTAAARPPRARRARRRRLRARADRRLGRLRRREDRALRGRGRAGRRLRRRLLAAARAERLHRRRRPRRRRGAGEGRPSRASQPAPAAASI